MLALTKFSNQTNPFAQLTEALVAGKTPILVSGAGEIHKAHMTAAVRQETGRPVVLVCTDEGEANRLGRDVAALTGETPVKLTSRELTFYPVSGLSRQAEQTRIGALYAMATGTAPIVIATVDGLMQRCMPQDVLLGCAETVMMGVSLDPQTLIVRLVRAGYRRCEQVEGPGQFALRGGILDFFSPAHTAPVRVEFWGDDIDSMAHFDPESQRRTAQIGEATILPTAEALPSLHPGGQAGALDALRGLLERVQRRKGASEVQIAQLETDIALLDGGGVLPSADRYMGLFYEEAERARGVGDAAPYRTPLDYLPAGCTVLLCELGRLTERGKIYLAEHKDELKAAQESGALEKSLALFCQPWPDVFEAFVGAATGRPCSDTVQQEYTTDGHWPPLQLVVMEHFAGSGHGLAFSPKALVGLLAKQLPSYGGSMETAEGDIRHYVETGYRTLVLTRDTGRAKRLMERLSEVGLPVQLELSPAVKLPEAGTCTVTLGSLSAGVEYPGVKLAVITEGQLLRTDAKPRKTRRRGKQLESYTDLSPGDLVVHEHHGIGRFAGITPMDIDGVKKDYIKIAYHGTDTLYVPATQLDLVSKYIGTGGEDKPVKLSRMGGAEWTRARSKAKGAAKDLAKGLIQLYAERQRQRGHAFAPDTAWQQEFEDAFEYTETEDQLDCVAEIKRDMMRDMPMDRLLCGDVGYGKTEVALRAVMKCVLEGKQAAILVPTTVLAQQHYVTTVRRFSGYPVRIEVLSRFNTPGQAKKITDAVEAGAVDIVIGTHKLLQKKMVFKDLGLLIVDEEQRFGVSHKERLKEMSKNVDVLTLSATPIPRTLNMALSGIRDMSTIEEPPQNRQPVQTYVMEHDWGVIADAIRRELHRGGQVYYLHNKIEGIERTAARVRDMVEGAQVAVAHGRMEEGHLSHAMERMISGEAQILVCTTIIETGIDIPNVNTLIIENADRLGLSQLHQIRGRVGRSSRAAFAYLTYRPDKALSEVATKRLGAIREFVEFNSGFKIALRDLEIRGAGNVLGREQSGHMMSVGYDMYLKLLNEAVLEEKGEKPEVRAECAADLAIDANIPAAYVAMPEARMDLYRRIAHIRTEEDASDVTDELIDRYGEPPKPVLALIQVARLRGEAARVGITEISQKGGHLQFTFLPERFELERVSAIYALPGFKGRVKILAGDVPMVRVKLSDNAVIDQAAAFVRAYGT
ncbi:MAG: transcription-repair coupling factor [Oscillospiraceae bacterium]|nr:transcription-repair coupling factor [Oscillospiraceae bacterium]